MGDVRNLYEIFVREHKVKSLFGRQRHRWGIILEWILRKWNIKLWSGFIWFTIRTSGGLLWAQ